MAVKMESATFMGKNFRDNQNSILNTTDLTLKDMFDISTKLVSEQDEISNLETFGWEKHSWKYLSLTGDERIINLQRTKDYVFSDSVLCLGKILQNPESNEAWKKTIAGVQWDILQKLTLIVRNLFSAGMHILQGTERRFMMDWGNLRQ